MIRYNWEHGDWPNFTYSLTKAEKNIAAFIEMVGNTSGMLKAIPEDIKTEALIDLMVAEAIKTSEIEGEFFSRADVMSSIKNNLGFTKDVVTIKDKNAEGIGKLMVDVRNTFSEKLDKKKLFEWHTMLMGNNKKYDYLITSLISGSVSRLFICLIILFVRAATYLLKGFTVKRTGFGNAAAISAASIRLRAAASLLK